jgi:lysophospholipase L1-like esterase
MNKYSYSLLFAAAALCLSACKPRLTPENYSKGELDFTRYVAVGNSLTAGYSDGTLYRSGQLAAYPGILSSSFSRFGPSDYKVPLLPGEAGWPSPKFVLRGTLDCSGTPSLSPVPYTDGSDTMGSAVNIAAGGPYNNLGVPGIKAMDYLNSFYGLLNPYSRRFFSSPSPLAELSRIQPTFFTLWIGNNDVLLYALSGGAGKSSGGSPFNFADQNSISGVDYFAAGVDSVLKRLMPAGSTANGVVINIPDITSIPHFTTVPYNGLVLSRKGQVDSLNLAYQPTGITFSLGANGFLIQDNSVPVLKYRKAVAGEYILLTVPQDSIKCGGWGSRKPIPAQYVLDQYEVKAIKDATVVFNGILKSAARARGLAYVDINSYMASIGNGILYNGVTISTSFVTGSAFSLDGVHLTPRGNALVANEIIRTINAYYGASIQTVDVTAYPGVLFP